MNRATLCPARRRPWQFCARHLQEISGEWRGTLAARGQGMAESNMAHAYGSQETGAELESDAERSGIRSSRVSIPRDADVRTTAKVPRVDLERLLAEERELAEDDEIDATMMLPPASRGQGPSSRDATLRLQAPALPPGMPSPLGSDFPPPAPEPTAVLTYTPVPLPLPPPSHRTSVEPFEKMRELRDDAKRTQRLVVAIWAFALTLAAGLGYFVVSQS